MNCWSFRLIQSSLVAVVLFLLPRFAGACAVCFGDPDSPATKGLTAAVVLLVAVIVFVLVGVVLFVVVMLRRSNRSNERGAQSATVAEGTHG